VLTTESIANITTIISWGRAMILCAPHICKFQEKIS